MKQFQIGDNVFFKKAIHGRFPFKTNNSKITEGKGMIVNIGFCKDKSIGIDLSEYPIYVLAINMNNEQCVVHAIRDELYESNEQYQEIYQQRVNHLMKFT